MKGWTEEEINNKNLRGACGIFCGACPIYIATRDNNEKLTSIICFLWKVKPEEAKCLGCMQSDPPQQLFVAHCQICTIRNCVKSKGIYSCHQCEKWPCSIIENSDLASVLPASIRNSIQRVMKRAIPLWREKVATHGNEKGNLEWARAEAERYHCHSCGEPLFRTAQKCSACKKPVAEELDGII